MSGAEESQVLLGESQEEIALDGDLEPDVAGINGPDKKPSLPARMLAKVKGFFKGKHSLEVEELEEFEPSEEALRELRSNINTAALLVLAVVAIGCALIFLEFVLVPLVLARFFVYLFQPLINYMVGKKHFGHRKLRCCMPRSVAVLVCSILVIVLLFLLGLAIYFSVMEIVEDSAEYVERLDELYQQAIDWAASLGVDLESAVDGLDLHVGDILVIVAGQFTTLAPQALLCIMFTIYMLMGYDETQEKSELQQSIDKSIRKYIVIKVLISLVTAGLVTAILAALQVDMFFMFGLFTFLLNFIPSVGSMIAVLLPLPVLLLDPDQTVWTIILGMLLPCAVQFLIGNFVEPNILGRSMNISAVAVLVALAFWGAVWGIVGAFMSVPLTVMLHLWLKSVPHPTAQFLGDLLAGSFDLFEDNDFLKDSQYQSLDKIE